MRWGMWLAMVSTGCGRLEFASLTDAASSSDTPLEDSVVACTWGPWQAPAPVPELDVAQNNMGDPALRADGLEIVVAVDMGAEDDLFRAVRQTATEPFGTLMPLTALNTPNFDNGAAYSSDGLTLYWMSSAGGYRLWRATRTDLALDFTNPEALPGGPFDEQGDPSITADGLELFHSSTLGEPFVATRVTTADDFGMPVPLGVPIASTQWQEGTSITADGLVLFYAEVDTNAMFRIWSARRSSRTSPFETPTMMTELLPDQAWDPELSADGRTFYFSRFVAGERDIWVTTRECL